MKRKFKKLIFVFLALFVILTWLADHWISVHTKDSLFSDISKVPYHKVGLLLGTSKNLSNGLPNQYFQNRILATVELYKAGKIDFVVVSGDNRQKDYNEPQDMKEALVGHKIPSDNGFKTKLREKFARVKLFIDLVMKKKPKFLGEPIEIKTL